jgi:hypothetical protein
MSKSLSFDQIDTDRGDRNEARNREAIRSADDHRDHP